MKCCMDLRLAAAVESGTLIPVLRVVRFLEETMLSTTPTHTCPNDQSPMLEAVLRQSRLVVQLKEEAGFFNSAGSVLHLRTCPKCGLTQFYAVPPLVSPQDSRTE